MRGHAGGQQAPVKVRRRNRREAWGTITQAVRWGKFSQEEILAFVKLDGIGMHVSKKHKEGPCAQFAEGMITSRRSRLCPPGLESSLGHFLLCVLGQAVSLSVRNFSCL